MASAWWAQTEFQHGSLLVVTVAPRPPAESWWLSSSGHVDSHRGGCVVLRVPVPHGGIFRADCPIGYRSSGPVLATGLVKKAYHTACRPHGTICSSNSKRGRIDCGILFGSLHDRNDSRSAAAPSDLRIWSKDTSHVVTTAFCDPL